MPLVEARVAVVVVSWNTRDLLARCLASLADSSLPLEIVVVDNASTDGSAEFVAREHPGAQLLCNDANVGFAAAVNQGLRATRAPFVLLVGSDAALRPEAAARLFAFLEAHADYAAAAPRLVGADGATQRACMNFPGWRTPLWFATPLERWFPRSAELERYFARDFDPAHDADVAQPPATVLLLRRAALDQVGTLDERLVLYFNDVDLSRRLAAAGWRTRFLADAVAVHAEGASTRLLPERLERWHLDRLRYFAKHHGPLAALWVKACASLAFLDFAARSLLGRAGLARRAPTEPLGPVTRSFVRFLKARG